MNTVRNQLCRMFGPEAPSQVADPDLLLDQEVHGVRLITSTGGDAQVECGGRAIAQFHNPNKRSSTHILLVLRTENRDAWLAAARSGDASRQPAGSCPHPRLTLILTG